MRRHQWLMLMAVVAAQEENVGDAVATTAGKWSVMHFLFSLGGTLALPDGSDGLTTAQKATMVGVYSEYAYA